MKTSNYISKLVALKGKTIAIVYIFEGEKAEGFQHYWVWKSDIISGWLNAVQELGCIPLILDVRTFIQKAINRDLPHVDYVLNLNCGCTNLSTLSLIPSMSSFLGIPCIPCDASTIIKTENKAISNLIAREEGINVPQNLNRESKSGIFRPLCLGSSIGVKIGPPNNINEIGTYQEFIPGYDVTMPLVFNPEIGSMDLLPPIIYIPKNKNPRWIYDEQEKKKDNGFFTYPVLRVEKVVRDKVIQLANSLPISTFGRIDARIISSSQTLSTEILSNPLQLGSLYFIEANSMPTIECEDSFEYAVEAVKNENSHSLKCVVDSYYDYIANPTINGFLLANAMLSFTTRY